MDLSEKVMCLSTLFFLCIEESPLAEVCILHFHCVLPVISGKRVSKDSSNLGSGLPQEFAVSSFLDS